MRDIRGDLQERANTIKEQMSAAHNQFEKRFEQLKLEHQSRLKNPVAELEAVKLGDRGSPAWSATASLNWPPSYWWHPNKQVDA
jgi:hypothetical protein